MLEKSIKKTTIKIAMVCLGRAFESAARFDPVIIEETRTWKAPVSIRMRVLPCGPCMTLIKNRGKIRYSGKPQKSCDLEISFKNIQSAFPVMAGFINAEAGFAQHRMIVKGDIPLAMSLIRCINRLQRLMLPRVISKRVLKRVRPLTLTDVFQRLRLYSTGILFKY